MEGRKFSAAEKGKGPVLDRNKAPRTARVRVQGPANDDLLHKHSLTIIGRVTKASVQKMWSLIAFFTELWKSDVRPIGSDLGQGMFQFQFQNEADLLAVLEKRPYHFAKWMVMVERWEPTTDPTFPSLIPFWIKVQGIPIHLWTEETVKSIGEDIGIYEEAEITNFSVRMRVQINGRLPLIKKTTIEYPNGDEVLVHLVYEKLEKHCTQCHKLDHERGDCLQAKALKREMEARSQVKDDADSCAQPGVRYEVEPKHNTPFQFPASRPMELESNPRYRASVDSRRDQGQRYFETRKPSHTTRDRAYRDRSWEHTSSRTERYPTYSRSRREYHPYRERSSRQMMYKEVGRRPNPVSDLRQQLLAKDDQLPVEAHTNASSNKKETPRALISTQELSARGIPLQMRQNTQIVLRDNQDFPLEALEEAMGEVREVMNQYVACPDPTESAARRERVRLAEEQGEVEETAEMMLSASLATQSRAHSERIYQKQRKESQQSSELEQSPSHRQSLEKESQ